MHRRLAKNVSVSRMVLLGLGLNQIKIILEIRWFVQHIIGNCNKKSTSINIKVGKTEEQYTLGLVTPYKMRKKSLVAK